MSDEEEELQTLFKCKLCDFASHTKGEIADHFISAHASIEIIESPVKSKRTRKTSEDATIKFEVLMDDENERTPSTTPVRRNSPRRTPSARSPRSDSVERTPTTTSARRNSPRRTQLRRNSGSDSVERTPPTTPVRRNSPRRIQLTRSPKLKSTSNKDKIQSRLAEPQEHTPTPSQRTRLRSKEGNTSPRTKSHGKQQDGSPNKSSQSRCTPPKNNPSVKQKSGQNIKRKGDGNTSQMKPVTPKEENHQSVNSRSPVRMLEKLQQDDNPSSSPDFGDVPSSSPDLGRRPQRKRRAPKWMEEAEVELPGNKKAKESAAIDDSMLSKKAHTQNDLERTNKQDNSKVQDKAKKIIKEKDVDMEKTDKIDFTIKVKDESSMGGAQFIDIQLEKVHELLSAADFNVTDNAEMGGHAEIGGNNIVGMSDAAEMNVQVADDARKSGDDAEMNSSAKLPANSEIAGNTAICEGADMAGESELCNDADMTGVAEMSANLETSNGAQMGGDGAEMAAITELTCDSKTDGDAEMDGDYDPDAEMDSDDEEMDDDAELDGNDPGNDNMQLTTIEAEWKRVSSHQNVPITMKEFEDKVTEALSEWHDLYTKEHRLGNIVCTKPECSASVFEREAELHDRCHMRDYHGFECIYCDERFSQWKNMRKHFAYCHDECTEVPKYWRCNKCERMFRLIDGLKRHVGDEHILPDTITSILASVALSQLGEDGRPVKRRPGRPKGTYKIKPVKRKPMKFKSKREDKPPRDQKISIKWMPRCGKCSAVYDRTEELDNHILLHEVDDEGKISCTECNQYFKLDEMHAHMKKEHKRKINPFRCVLCEFSSGRRHDVKKHMYCHEGVKRFQCDICGNLMSTPYNLKIHRQRVHATEEEKTILCSFCGFKCANRAVLKDHMRHKHDLCMSGQKTVPSTKEENLPTFPCTQCDYVGKKESSLKHHMRLHTENRPFKCQMCPYASKTKNNLILHIRTHNGMAPHQCPHCEFRGATTLIVKEHIMAKHTAVKPLQCSICNWSTCYNGNLWKHMQMHKIENGILLPGKPKRATRKGICYENETKRFGKLLPITIDGLGEPTPEEEAEVREVERASGYVDVPRVRQIDQAGQMIINFGDEEKSAVANLAKMVNIPINIGGLGETTIMVVPGDIQQQFSSTGAGVVTLEQPNEPRVVTLESGQQQVNNGNQTISFQPSVISEDNLVQFEIGEQTSGVDEVASAQPQEVISSVSGDTNIQQSISSIITSMAASAAAAAQQTTVNHPNNTLIETQLSASEVASQFEDGTIIEITQIPTSSDGRALIPEGAIVEKIAPGMSASDIIMKAANMVAAGQTSRSLSSEYLIPVSVNNTLDENHLTNTLPFLAHVATSQENLPETDAATLQIVDALGGSNAVPQETADAGSQEAIEPQAGEMVEQYVATMLPDGSNVMQIIQPTMQDE